jgi:ribonuclease P protein component
MSDAHDRTGPAAGPLRFGALTRRAEYQAVASKGFRLHRPCFTLQVWLRPEETAARTGWTVTKKEGGAVERNRIRRRLREAWRTGGATPPVPADIVVIGRRAALSAPFQSLAADLKEALAEAARRKPRRNPRRDTNETRPESSE